MIDIDALVAAYGAKDAQAKQIKKEMDADKETIKDFLAGQSNQSYTAGGYTVQRVVSERENLNEEKLLTILKADWIATHGSMECPYIKTKEYIDMDALEEAIYQSEISPATLAQMDKCREVTTVVALKCKKAK